MSLPWFRMYHRIIDDDKLRLLAFEDRWHFVALCCLKAEGLLDADDDSLRDRRIAVKLGVQVRELEEIGRRLQEVGLIDSDLSPTSWDELQFKSDKDATAARRQREKRNRDKALKDVTDASRVTDTEVTRLDTDTDTDTEKTSCETDVSLKPEHVVEIWNKTAVNLGKPKVRDITPERRQLLKARIAQYSVDDFIDVFGKVERSKFLRGDTGWRGCGFDWVFKKANFQKILEGNYDE